LNGNEKKTWEKNQYTCIYFFADKQSIQMQKGSSPYLYITSTVYPEFAQNTQYLNNFITKAYDQQALKKSSFQTHFNYSLTVIFQYDTFIYFRYFFSTKFFLKT